MDELLDHLGGGGRSDAFVGDCRDEIAAGIAEWMLGAFGIDEDGGVEHYHPRRARRASSSCFSSRGSGTDMSAASSRRLPADLRG
ncbi:Uncharacterised protein [Mycobacterium tuberculosis]|nr:Uncharacterised protein [Mycobacterium tuberculosis]